MCASVSPGQEDDLAELYGALRRLSARWWNLSYYSVPRTMTACCRVMKGKDAVVIVALAVVAAIANTAITVVVVW